MSQMNNSKRIKTNLDEIRRFQQFGTGLAPDWILQIWNFMKGDVLDSLLDLLEKMFLNPSSRNLRATIKLITASRLSCSLIFYKGELVRLDLTTEERDPLSEESSDQPTVVSICK